MGFLVLNNARTTLSGAVSIGDTSLPVADGSLFAVGTDYSYITIENNAGQIETVKLTARSGGTLTIAAPGTVYAWASGSIVECRPCSQAVAAIVEDTIHDASAETTIADGDELPIVDVSASNVLKKITWANVKATLKTYFDTLYTAIATCLPLAGGTMTGGINEARGSVAMHATTMNLWAQPNIIDGTGSFAAVIDIVDAPQAGARRTLYPIGGSTIAHGGAFAVDGGALATAETGDAWEFEAITVSTFKVHITKYDGSSIVTKALKSATTSVDVSAATAPSVGQVLKATSSTAATWQDEEGRITLGIPEPGTPAPSFMEFVSLPSGINWITINVKSVSATGAAVWMVQIGDSGGYETADYYGGAGDRGGEVANSTGFTIIRTVSAAGLYSGSITLLRENSFTNSWVETGLLALESTGQTYQSAGVKSLSGTLTSVRVITTDAFDGGEVNIVYG